MKVNRIKQFATHKNLDRDVPPHVTARLSTWPWPRGPPRASSDRPVKPTCPVLRGAPSRYSPGCPTTATAGATCSFRAAQTRAVPRTCHLRILKMCHVSSFHSCFLILGWEENSLPARETRGVKFEDDKKHDNELLCQMTISFISSLLYVVT